MEVGEGWIDLGSRGRFGRFTGILDIKGIGNRVGEG